MTTTIRDARPDDAECVAALLAEMGYPTSHGAAVMHVARFADDPSSRLQAAVLETGEVVGLVATHAVPRLDEDAYSCRVTDLVVLGRHRRSGVGSALMAAAEQEARRVGAPRLDLSSGEWRDDAHAFYSRLGFTSRARSFTKRVEI